MVTDFGAQSVVLGLELGDPGLHLLDLGVNHLLHTLVLIGVLQKQVVAVAGVFHDENRVRLGRGQGAAGAEVGRDSLLAPWVVLSSRSC